jgi:hypothetical protein
MTIEPKDATHIRLKQAVYPASVFLTAGTTHAVKDYDSSSWRIEDPAYPGKPSRDWWVDTELAEAVPAPDTFVPEGTDATWLEEVSAAAMPPNPKQIYGDKKPPLDQFPLSAHIHACLALADGANKYGFRNWRDQPVEARTYIKGAMRHLRLFEVGENNTRDSDIHNLGAVIAGCAILIDAQLHGTMIDNRRHSPEEADLLHTAEAIVAHLADLQAGRDAAKRDKLTPVKMEPVPQDPETRAQVAAIIAGRDALGELETRARRPLFTEAISDGPDGPEFPDRDGDTLAHRRAAPVGETTRELTAEELDALIGHQ